MSSEGSKDGSLTSNESRNYWELMLEYQNMNYANQMAGCIPAAGKPCTPAYNPNCGPGTDKPNPGLIGLPYECLCGPLVCNTPEIKQLREQLNQVKQDYDNQMAACKRISNLVKKVAPQALKSGLGVDLQQDVAERPEIQADQQELSIYQTPDEENTGQPFAPSDEGAEEAMPLLPPSDMPLNLPGMDKVESPKDSVCDQFKDQLNAYSDQIRNKDQVIECIEINLLRLDRQGTLIEKNFNDIEQRYNVLMEQYNDLEEGAAQSQGQMKQIEDMVPEETHTFKKSILKIMLKLETDFVNCTEYLKVQNALDAERMLLKASLDQHKSERIQLINKRAQVQMRMDQQMRKIQENAGKLALHQDFLPVSCCSKGKGEQAENPFITKCSPTTLRPTRKSSIREAFHIQDGQDRKIAVQQKLVEVDKLVEVYKKDIKKKQGKEIEAEVEAYRKQLQK